ncbi:MAG: diguanylate cyclase, partial [Henriciella sp.]|uniref:GGDEF domain-containing protein n=1 Tax=Henriciella sp. TaxID=1968823 RepID=UPI003C74C9D2
ALFGIGAILSMLAPTTFSEGVLVDGRAVLVGMAAAMIGWRAGLIAALIAAGFRWHIGGAGALAGCTGIVLAAALGFVWQQFLRPSDHISARHFAGLGLLISLSLISILFLPWPVALMLMETAVPVLIVCYVICAVILGTLVEREQELIRIERYWRASAQTDPLTGLPNRREFERSFHHAQLLKGARRKGCALLVLDIDHFKSINDQYGHAGGDEALKCFATRLQLAIRTQDHVSRIGGEEFAVLLPETTSDAARMVANKIRMAIRQQPVRVGPEDEVYVTVSIGGAACDGADIPGPTLQARADAALYAAKRAGRDRAEFAASGSPDFHGTIADLSRNSG